MMAPNKVHIILHSSYLKSMLYDLFQIYSENQLI